MTSHPKALQYSSTKHIYKWEKEKKKNDVTKSKTLLADIINKDVMHTHKQL